MWGSTLLNFESVTICEERHDMRSRMSVVSFGFSCDSEFGAKTVQFLFFAPGKVLDMIARLQNRMVFSARSQQFL